MQTCGPYGNQRYVRGNLGTDKGCTGQFHDSLTGLDYYNARFYDPVMAQFLTPDVQQGNPQGMDPYNYVGNNPTTRTDPTGQRPIGCDPGSDGCDSKGKPTGGKKGGDDDIGHSGDCGEPCRTDGNGGKKNPPPSDGGDCTFHHKPCSETNNPCDKATEFWSNGGCHNLPDPTKKKAKQALDNYYNDQMSVGGLIIDGLNILLDIAQAFNFFKLWDGGAINALIQILTAIGDAIHFVADLLIKFGGNVVSDFVGALLRVSDAVHTITVFANTVWTGLGVWGFFGNMLSDSILAPEMAGFVMFFTGFALGAQLAMGVVQWHFIDESRIEMSNVDNNMTPEQQYKSAFQR